MSAQRLAPSAKLLAACAILAIICHAFQSFAATPTADEMSRRSAWLEGYVGSRAATPAFSFAYGGHDAGRSLVKWKRTASTHAFADRTLHATSFTDPQTGLVARCEVAEFRDHAAVEWVVYLKNTGSADTPILADIRALDDLIPSPSGDAVLHYARGAVCSMDDFAPLTETLRPGTRLHLEPAGGRSSSDFLPFFNLEMPSRGGVVIGLGWSGEWAADFIKQCARRTRVRAGMALTHLKLHPGEEIRTPQVALLFYQGDWIRGQNLWRRFVLDQHRPKANGQPLDPPVFNGNWGGTPGAGHLENIKAIVAHDLPVEFYWIDAEWFGRGAWWMNPGDWNVKRDLYPEGFKAIATRCTSPVASCCFGSNRSVYARARPGSTNIRSGCWECLRNAASITGATSGPSPTGSLRRAAATRSRTATGSSTSATRKRDSSSPSSSLRASPSSA